MRNARQNKLIEIISQIEVETQEQLSKLLSDAGFKVTQATVSRDIKDLQLVKKLTSSGRYKYSTSDTNDGPIQNRFLKIFKETITSVNSANNLIVIKSLSGCGPATGEAIDSLKLQHIVGSIAGDNTILLIADSEDNVKEIINELDILLK